MDAWTSGDAYEQYIGRWSARAAPAVLAWARLPDRATVLDVGCGTGAVSTAVLAAGAARVHGIDPSETFVAAARRRLPDARFDVADAQRLPFPDASFDAAVSGLVLNFIPDAGAAAREIRRVLRPHGVFAAYVWDYAGRMEMLRHFWDAAVLLDPAARPLDESVRFPLCDPGRLDALLRAAGFAEVQATNVDVAAEFRDFDDFWQPFLGGNGPAPAYVASLPPQGRDALRERVRARLPVGHDGTIPLTLRVFAVRGVVDGAAD